MKKLTSALAMAMLLAFGTGLAMTDAAFAEDKGKKRPPRAKSFAECDKDGDGALSISEFAACYPRLSEQHFKAADADKDGKLTREEMRAMHQKRKMERRNALFQKCDTNKDGVLSPDEFMACEPKRKGNKGHKKGPGKQ